MNAGYFHLVINHFPIIGTIIGSLLLITGFVTRMEGIKLSGLGTLLFAAIMAIPTMLSGDPAEDALEQITGISKQLIDNHEDMALVGMWLIIPLGLISAMAIYSLLKKELFGKYLVITAMIFSIITSGVMMYVGRTGGMIRHTEFHQNNNKAQEASIEHTENEKTSQ